MPSTMFMIPSIACCKLPSPMFWRAKRCTLSKRDDASLTWTRSILLFFNVQEIFLFQITALEYVLKEKEFLVELDMD